MIYQITTSCIIEVNDNDELSDTDKRGLEQKFNHSIRSILGNKFKGDLVQHPVTVNVDQVLNA